MLSDNIKNLRKSKGYSQEELAMQLNVVRQTVSKWEKNLSVPDSEMLVRLATILDVSVSDLLESKCMIENERTDEIASYLEKINEQLLLRNRKIKTIIKIIVGVMIGIIALNIMLLILGRVTCVNTNTWTEETHNQIME